VIAEYIGMGAVGYWLGILIGLSFAAVLLIKRLYKLSNEALVTPPNFG
jgi:Na+-driven multidrug efflux pump